MRCADEAWLQRTTPKTTVPHGRAREWERWAPWLQALGQFTLYVFSNITTPAMSMNSVYNDRPGSVMDADFTMYDYILG